MAEGQYNINDIYQGGVSSFDPEYGDLFTGYRVAAGELGAPTKADTANQLQQVGMLLNQGIIPIEVGALDPKVFDAIPKEHFKEINRKAKLAGAKISVHAPIVAASGITDQGFEESNRRLAENQLKHMIDMTAPLNDKGGMSITVHASGRIPGAEYEMVDGKKKQTSMFVVNKETGKLTTVLKEEKKAYPLEIGTTGEITEFTIPEQLTSLNKTEWENTLSQILHHIEDADSRIKDSSQILLPEILHKVLDGEMPPNLLKPEEINAYHRLQSSQVFLSDARKAVNGMFDKAWKYANEEDKKRLKDASEHFAKHIAAAQRIKNKDLPQSVANESMALHNLIESMQQIVPEVYQPIEDFALDHSAKTFANVALHGLKEHKDNAPVINVENVFPEMAFSTGEELDRLVTKTKEEFVSAAVKELGISESNARQKADKLIGVTLDVGHLNLSRKHGFTEEDLLKEVEQVAKHVKHVHLTDNFGREDSHLAPGMGNVPFKEILERLNKEGFKGTKIVEAPGIPQHFGVSPLPYTLKGMGSSIFKGGQAPYWTQSQGLLQQYSGGFGHMLPQINYETFGAGFTQLPLELGGSRPGAQGSRLSGKGME